VHLKGGLMIRCSEEETEALLAKPGARTLEIRGREMKYCARALAMQSVAFARALPPKEKK
jgi:hypothetical protein